MKYSKEFYQMIAYLNPAIYDAVYPMGPIKVLAASPVKEYRIENYQSKGSIFGTDLSGELKVLAKFSWRMNSLVQDLHSIVTQSKISGEQKNGTQISYSFVSELIDDICGTGPHPIHFPPKPHWINDKFSIEEKVAAASIFAYASFAVEGLQLEKVLTEGADKILDSAMSQLREGGNRINQLAFNNVLANS